MIPTAEEFLDKEVQTRSKWVTTVMIGFAKLHVKAALKAAKEVDKKNRQLKPKSNQRFSILNAYPETLIK